MYALKRIFAYILDYALIGIPTVGGLGLLQTRFAEQIPDALQTHASLASAGLTLVAPALILGVLTGLTGRTPGKLLMFLKVQDHGGDPPGLAQGVLRELVKAASLGLFFFGMIYALGGVVTGRRTFYDNWLDLDVDDLRPSGLTPTQKNFRKYMREKQRQERKVS